MNEYISEAISECQMAWGNLDKFVYEKTDFEVTMNEGGYPIIFTFTPRDDAMQESMFAPDENGFVGEIKVICSSTGVGVDLGVKCHIQAQVLKKLIAHCEACASARLHADRAERCLND